MNKIKWLAEKALILALACMGPIAIAQKATAQSAPQQMTLTEAIAAGVMTNPEYGVVAATRRATDEELEQAKGLYLPSIDFNADTGFEYTDDVGTRNRINEDDDETLWRYEVGLTLTQMLFDGFEVVPMKPSMNLWWKQPGRRG